MCLSFSTTGSAYCRPIRRLMAKRVLVGLVTAWRLAGWPTRRSPSSRKATTEGVVRAPSAFSITLGVLPSMMATHEFGAGFEVVRLGSRAVAGPDLGPDEVRPVLRLPDVRELVDEGGLQAKWRLAEVGRGGPGGPDHQPRACDEGARPDGEGQQP